MECFSWMLAIDFLFCFMFFHLAARLFRTLRFGYTSLQIPYRGFNFKWQPQWFEPIARQQSGCISELLILWVGQERNGICSWSPENCFVFRFQNRKWGLRLCQRENPGTTSFNGGSCERAWMLFLETCGGNRILSKGNGAFERSQEGSNAPMEAIPLLYRRLMRRKTCLPISITNLWLCCYISVNCVSKCCKCAESFEIFFFFWKKGIIRNPTTHKNCLFNIELKTHK